MTEVIMNQERDKFLTEVMTCKHDWHKPYEYIDAYECRICKQTILNAPDVYTGWIINFSTPEGFFELWDFSQEQDWWDDLCDWFYEKYDDGEEYRLMNLFINPDRFANSVYEFLKNFDN